MIPMHLHSHYSALDGYATPDEIAERVESLGLAGCFLTDHGVVAGLHEFRKAMDRRGLWAGYGMEAYQSAESRLVQTGFKKGQDEFHLVLLARSREGYKNLLRISDAAHRTGFYWSPRVDWDLLERHKEGLVATSSCYGSLVNDSIVTKGDLTPLNKMVEIFGDNYLIELHTYRSPEVQALNVELVRIAKERGIPLVYANDAHYAKEEQYMEHEAFLCAQFKTTLDGPKRHGHYQDGDIPRYHPPCLFIMSEQEVRDSLIGLPQWAIDEAIDNSDALMQECTFTLENKSMHLPKAKLAEGADPVDTFIDKVEAGLDRIYGDREVPEEVIDRLSYEMRSIIEAGLHDYFLIVEDYVSYALSKGYFVGPGRGSVCGSMVAYVLDITSVNSIERGLQFERFWNPGRAAGLPDIDIDFQRSNRQAMLDFMRRKYGEGRVQAIGNHVTMGAKQAVQKAGMVLYEDPPYADIKRINNIIETTTDAGKLEEWDDVMEMVGDELAPYITRYPELFDLAESFSGRIGSYSSHASAVVVSDVDLDEHLPARMVTSDMKTRVVVTQAEMHEVEEKGFPKFDFLGLLKLDTIMGASLLSGKWNHIEGEVERKKAITRFYRHELDIDSLPEEFWTLPERGLTLGLFQVEMGDNARRVIKQLKPRCLDDLVAFVALNRPGPLRSGETDLFISRRNGEKPVDYLHPILEPILKNTQGIFLYQEQLLDFFKVIGYSLSDADHIRKIMGKKLVEEMQAEKPRYMEAAEKHMSKQAAESIWDSMISFSKYGFNKSHAEGYARILAYTMYIKYAMTTSAYMAAIRDNPKRIGEYVAEARRMGVNVLAPDIQRSNVHVDLVDGEILFGLSDIKKVGDTTAEAIVTHRPFSSPESFYKWAMDYRVKNGKASLAVVNSQHRKLLMDAGAFDSYGYRLAECQICGGKGKVAMQVPKKNPALGTKRALVECTACEGIGMERCDIPDKRVRADAEEEAFGVVLTDLYSGIIESNADDIETLNDFSDLDNPDLIGEIIEVPGIVTGLRETRVGENARRNAGEEMAHVGLAWGDRHVWVTAFPDNWRDFKFALKPRTVGKYKVKITQKGVSLVKAHKYVERVNG